VNEVAYRRKSEPEGRTATLKELLHPDVVKKLAAQADAIKAEAARRKEEERRRAEEARAAERKRLENDFGHLLKNSNLDWKKFK
jgi:hypothetical protein